MTQLRFVRMVPGFGPGGAPKLPRAPSLFASHLSARFSWPSAGGCVGLGQPRVEQQPTCAWPPGAR
eukprot:909887-Lingulodinium_polyedra.AAC.1